MTYRLLICIFTFFVIKGCTSHSLQLEKEEKDHFFQKRLININGIDVWELEGRLAISDGSQKGFNAKIRWTLEKKGALIEIYSLFGGINIKIQTDDVGVKIWDHDSLISESESLNLKELGLVNLLAPITAINVWIKGIPTTDEIELLKLDALGKPKSFRQLGWNILFTEYKSFSGTMLPTKITLSNSTNDRKIDKIISGIHSDKIIIKLMINKWHVNGN